LKQCGRSGDPATNDGYRDGDLPYSPPMSASMIGEPSGAIWRHVTLVGDSSV
jgi:hypothetical protein